MKKIFRTQNQIIKAMQEKTGIMANQNGVLAPKGKIVKRITIEINDQNQAFVNGANLEVGVIGLCDEIRKPMDIREMSLCLMRVSLDTATVIYNQLSVGASESGQENNEGNNVQ